VEGHTEIGPDGPVLARGSVAASDSSFTGILNLPAPHKVTPLSEASYRAA
jgi:hypothetical protein